ncbi:MAG: preprotein translocase subunit YajC [bacterium]|nr:MAG: preprotein translocase subunit YajC [bacterium]
MFTGIAYAAQPTGTTGGIGAFAPLIFLFIIFYFLLIRPQQKKAKEHQATLDGLVVGDTVITNGGIYGTVIRIEGHVVLLQCSDKVRIKIIKKAISAKVDPVTMEGE